MDAISIEDPQTPKSLDNAKINETWYTPSSDRKSVSPQMSTENEDTKESSSFLKNISSIPNDFPTTFPTNILEVQRIFAAHMLMIEKQKRLMQNPSDSMGSINLIDLVESKKENAKAKDNVEREEIRDSVYEVKKDMLHPSTLPSNVYSRPFPSIQGGHSKEKVDGKFFLEYAKCYLETKELWEKFHRLGTEMIITKTGR